MVFVKSVKIRFFIYLAILSSTIFAHPHTFIEIYPNIKIKDNTIVNIDFKWKLDEMTSSMLIMEFDQNQDGKIDKEETAYVYESFFKTLRDYNFYTDIKVKNLVQSFPEPKNFLVTIEENKVCYSFSIDKQYNIKDTIIDFGDEDFFIAMILKDEFVKIDGAKAKVEELDNDFYFGYRLRIEK